MFSRKRKFDRALRERGVPPTVESHHDEDRDLTTGPFDVLDAPDDDLPRLDLGAMRIPALPDFEVRLELTEAGQLTGIALRYRDTDMQIGVFAAPRAGEMWADIRSDIAEELNRSGATTTEVETEFGTELRSTQKKMGATFESRFIGVDGPRWFLRALVAGPLAADEDDVAAFREVVRGVVVDRGTEPKPVREPLTLTLPADLAEQAAAQAAERAGTAE